MHVDLKKYMGKWFEIARIKNEFEPNMKKVTAQYNLNEDDTIQVINSGYIDDTLKEIIGTAKTTNENNLLLISFRHPIYSQYKILFVDDDYQYALVGGSSENYLWILSRTPNLDKTILDKLINIAKEEKYNVNKIVLTEQN